MPNLKINKRYFLFSVLSLLFFPNLVFACAGNPIYALLRFIMTIVTYFFLPIILIIFINSLIKKNKKRIFVFLFFLIFSLSISVLYFGDIYQEKLDQAKTERRYIEEKKCIAKAKANKKNIIDCYDIANHLGIAGYDCSNKFSIKIINKLFGWNDN
jgi:hypothetical protein